MNSVSLRTLACLLLAGSTSLLAACSDDESDDNGMTPDTGMGDTSEPGDTTPEPTSTFDLRVVHLSPDTPAVMVYVGGEPQDTAALPAPLAFPDATPFLTLDAGTYTFNVRTADADPTSAPALTLTSAIEEGVLTVAAIGTLGDGPDLQLLVLAEEEAPGANEIRIRAVHAAPGVGQVDIWNITDAENPSPLYENVDFGVAGDFLTIPAGAYEIGIDVDNDAVPDLTFSTGEVAGGTQATLFAVNDADGNVSLRLLTLDGVQATIAPN